MPHIATIPPADATGELAEIYAKIEAAMGQVPEALQLNSLSPPLLRQFVEFIGYYMGHPTLSASLLAFLRVRVSMEGECDYCIGFNGGMLINQFGWTPEQLAEAKKDHNAAPFTDKEKALIGYCLDVVQHSGKVDPARIEGLRRLGWDDRDIYDAVLHATRNFAADMVINAFGLSADAGITR